MKKIILYFGVMAVVSSAILFVYYHAGRFSTTYSDLQETIDLRSKTSERLDSGKWFINTWAAYHTLSFESADTLTVYNKADTIQFAYRLEEHALLLLTANGALDNKIFLHNNEELVFENFLESRKKIRYTRKLVSSK